MRKDPIFVSWQDQLEMMEGNACGSGSTCYESVRSEFLDGLRSKYGRYADFDLEEIPEKVLAAFIIWVESEEDEE